MANPPEKGAASSVESCGVRSSRLFYILEREDDDEAYNIRWQLHYKRKKTLPAIPVSLVGGPVGRRRPKR